jgi:hypothetical protein
MRKVIFSAALLCASSNAYAQWDDNGNPTPQTYNYDYNYNQQQQAVPFNPNTYNNPNNYLPWGNNNY